MEEIKRIIIDKNYESQTKSLYRYNIIFEDDSSIGSCYCYNSIDDAFKAVCLVRRIKG